MKICEFVTLLWVGPSVCYSFNNFTLNKLLLFNRQRRSLHSDAWPSMLTNWSDPFTGSTVLLYVYQFSFSTPCSVSAVWDYESTPLSVGCQTMNDVFLFYNHCRQHDKREIDSSPAPVQQSKFSNAVMFGSRIEAADDVFFWSMRPRQYKAPTATNLSSKYF